MASTANGTPAASDGGRTGERAWNRGMESRFEWVASSPSPAEVAALERRFPEVIQVPVQALEEEASDWRLRAVIARSLSRWIPAEAIVREFHRGGIHGDVESVCLAHRHYIFRFSDPAAKKLALGRPWMANGQLIAVEDWLPQFVPSDGSLPSALLWIRLPSLPIEFWSEEIIGSILSVAGEFQFIDAATRERKRGGFARACVRVDLSNPLRPGARVGGAALPFWQQFVYEHLEGICVDCGSVHPAGCCLSSPSGAASSDNLAFGPWMAALRRRRSSLYRGIAPGSKDQQGAAVSSDGWQNPKKFARRGSRAAVVGSEGLCPVSQRGEGSRDVKAGRSQGSASAQHRVSGGGSLAVPNPLLAEKAVSRGAVPVLSEAAAGSEVSLKHPNVSTANPFALLGSENSVDRPGGREEANPGPLKRARPVETAAPRMVSKTLKGKGKISTKSAMQSSLNFSASLAEMTEPVTFLGNGSKAIRAIEVHGSDGPSDAPQLVQEECRSHDSVVSLLKKAIQQKATVEDMDSMDQCHSEGRVLGSCSSDDQMVGVVVAPPHPE